MRYAVQAQSVAQAHLFQPPAEPLKDSLHVASFLHGDDAGVILLIDPNEEGFLMVVPEGRKLGIKETATFGQRGPSAKLQ